MDYHSGSDSRQEGDRNRTANNSAHLLKDHTRLSNNSADARPQTTNPVLTALQHFDWTRDNLDEKEYARNVRERFQTAIHCDLPQDFTTSTDAPSFLQDQTRTAVGPSEQDLFQDSNIHPQETERTDKIKSLVNALVDTTGNIHKNMTYDYQELYKEFSIKRGSNPLNNAEKDKAYDYLDTLSLDMSKKSRIQTAITNTYSSSQEDWASSFVRRE